MPSQRSHLVKTKIWKKCHNSSTLAVSLVVTTRLMQGGIQNQQSSQSFLYTKPPSKINVHTKLKPFKSTIIPTLLYSSETWNFLQHHIQRLQVFTNRCLRIITGTSLWEKMKNTQLRRKANIERIDVMIQKRRL